MDMHGLGETVSQWLTLARITAPLEDKRVFRAMMRPLHWLRECPWHPCVRSLFGSLAPRYRFGKDTSVALPDVAKEVGAVASFGYPVSPLAEKKGHAVSIN